MDKRRSTGKKANLSIFIIIGIFAYFTYIMFAQQKLLLEKNIEVKSIEAKVTEENKLNGELTKQKAVVNTDEYIEKIAREKLGMVKRGEKVFIDTNK